MCLFLVSEYLNVFNFDTLSWSMQLNDHLIENLEYSSKVLMFNFDLNKNIVTDRTTNSFWNVIRHFLDSSCFGLSETENIPNTSQIKII